MKISVEINDPPSLKAPHRSLSEDDDYESSLNVFYLVQQYADVRCLRTMLEVKKANLLNLAFIKLQKSVVDDYFWFESCIDDDKKRVLGFDKNGAPLKTTEVEPGSKESLLDSHLVDIEES